MNNFKKNNFNLFKENILFFVKNQNPSFIIEDEEILDLFNKSDESLNKDLDKLNKKIIHITQQHIDSAKQLMDLFGIKYIHEDCEAESLLSVLSKNNIIDACISEDTDVLANGGYLFLRNFNADKNTIDEYCLQGILDSLKITHDQFIDLCILCGCDYTTKIHGIGPITAYKLILQYVNIENILEKLKNNNKFTIPENFEYNRARELFKNPISMEILNKIDKNLFIDKPKINLLKDFLKTTKLKDKFYKEIDINLMNYFLNIESVYKYDNTNKTIIDN